MNYYTVLKSYITGRHFQVKFRSEISKIHEIKSGVPQGSIIGPLLYLLFTYDLPISNHTTLATFADDTALLSSHQNPATASSLLQSSLDTLTPWLHKWRIKVNGSKCTHVTFTNRRENCPPVTLDGNPIPTANEVKYLGIHLDRRLTWRTHIFTKRKQLGIQLQKLSWLMGYYSSTTIETKLTIYKSILKPIWTYGIQLWGTAANSNIEILQRFQSKTLRTLCKAPWFVTNDFIHRDTQIEIVKEEIKKTATKYKQRLHHHPNSLATNLMQPSSQRRLRRRHPSDLV